MKNLDLVFKSHGAGVDPFGDLKEERADFFEIVFIGPGPATMVVWQ